MKRFVEGQDRAQSTLFPDPIILRNLYSITSSAVADSEIVGGSVSDGRRQGRVHGDVK
jgi:hypothetical protein